MTRYNKDGAGKYMVGGKKYEMLEGSRAQVWHGTALKTSGGLQKHHLHMNKHGRVVSKKKFETARKEKRLVKAGYGTVKGKFGFVKLHGSKKMRGSKKGSKKMRGGYSSPYGALDAAPFGAGQEPSGVYTPAYESNGYTPKAHYAGGKRSRRRH
jgi:hypothetical protein